MDIFAEILTALETQERVVLATIISSSGSTPLPPGASMMFREHGQSPLGTIGGGLLEAGVIKEVMGLSAANTPFLIRQYELDQSGSEGGMICGGTVAVLIEQVTKEDTTFFSRLFALNEEMGECTLVRALASDGQVAHRFALKGGCVDAQEHPRLMSLVEEWDISAEEFLQNSQRAHRRESVLRVAGSKGEMIIQPVSGIQPLIIFGGGHIGRSLSRIAALSGFSVTVVDDRMEYAHQDRFPEAQRTLAKSWGNAFQEISFKPSSSIAIVTRGHQSDKEVLRYAVKTPARYIGMIGSGRKVAATFKQLQEEGVPIALLQRVHAPMGLKIGSVTAEEIAVSIVAELISVRRAVEKETEQIP